MSQNKIQLLYNQLKDYNYIIVEGFEKVGKSTLIDRLVEISNNKFNSWKIDYHSNYSSMKDIPYNQRYLIGNSVLEVLSQNLVSLNKPLIVDRGFISSIVYSELYNQDLEVNPNFVWYSKHYQEIFKKYNILILYVSHNSKEEASVIYQRSIPEESYDQFESFEEYWLVYEKAHHKFLKYITPINHILFKNIII